MSGIGSKSTRHKNTLSSKVLTLKDITVEFHQKHSGAITVAIKSLGVPPVAHDTGPQSQVSHLPGGSGHKAAAEPLPRETSHSQ